MQTLRKIVDSEELSHLINLPQSFQNRKVEMVIQLIVDKRINSNLPKRIKQKDFQSESFGMWKDRTDIFDDVNQYVRNLRKERQFDY
ncbi:MAG: hypothetical protein LBV16_08560 [Elusimicrobiota bacterium]|jgi:hypothetical protein|nr:hypothetical protein [Elusimicrobiota bacterium]